MTDEQKPPESVSSTEAWREVGQQFESLGQSLANAFRAMWAREENRQQVEQIKSNLEQMANEVSQAVKQAAGTVEGQDVKAHARKAAESAQKAGQVAIDEARPHLVKALRQVNTELQKLIDQWEAKAQEEAPAEPEAPGELPPPAE